MAAGDPNQVPAAGLPDAGDRPHRSRGPNAGPLLVVFGLAFFAMALSRSFLALIDRTFGYDRFLAASLGFLFLFLAYASRDIQRLRERLLDLAEEILKIFYGPDFRRQREAVDILVRAMHTDNASVRRSSREHLIRLTGEDHGDDPVAWANWWESSRSTFRSKEGPSDAS